MWDRGQVLKQHRFLFKKGHFLLSSFARDWNHKTQRERERNLFSFNVQRRPWCTYMDSRVEDLARLCSASITRQASGPQRNTFSTRH